MDFRQEKQGEEAMVSSEEKSTGVRRTRPTERAKEKEKEERENMKAKENSEEKESRGQRGAMMRVKSGSKWIRRKEKQKRRRKEHEG